MSWLKTIFTWWHGPTFGTWLHTRRRGVEVGRDDQGNVYYRSKQGDRRWVVYNGDVEASRTPPEWHMWLHRQIQTPPSEKPLPAKVWEKAWQANPTGSLGAHAPSGSLNASGVRARATGDYEAWAPE